MRHFIAVAALATTAYAMPQGRFQANGIRPPFSNSTTTSQQGYVPIDPVTTTFQYLCPTGIKDVETTITALPVDSTSIGDVVPGWTEYVTVCSVCEDSTKEVTLTLPPGVAPTGPESGPVTTGYKPDTPADTSSPAIPGIPGQTGTPDTPAPTTTNGDVYTTAITTEFVYECPTGLSTVQTVVTELPAESTSYDDIIPGWTTTVGICSACKGQPEITYTLPPGIAPTGGMDGPATTTTAGSEEKPAPTGTGSEDSPAPTATENEPSAPPASEYAPIVSAPVPTDGEEVVTTVLSCTFTDIGEDGLTTKTLGVTKEIPATATDETYSVSMTETVTLCTVCGTEPTEVTLTVPAGDKTPVTDVPEETGSGESPAESVPIVSVPIPTGGEEVITTVVSCTYTDVGKDGLTTKTTEVTKEIPATATDETYSISMTETVTLCTVCGEKPTSVTLTVPVYDTPDETGSPAETTGGEDSPAETTAPGDDSPTTTDYVPVVSAPVPTSGEDVITTVVSCTYTDIGKDGLTTRTTEVTKEIPATATDETYSISMTETVTLCTVCGDEPASVTLTVPVKSPVTTSANVDTPVTTGEGAPSTTEYAPVVSAPVPTAGEDVTTTVVSCTYTDIGKDGLTARTTEVTKEIPATATDETYSISMTETVTLCTVCGEKPTSVTLTVPVKAPITTTSTVEVPVTTDVPEEITTTAPVVSAPSPTEGEEVITTVVSCTFTDIGEGGYTTRTTKVTKEIPASASETSLSFDMTTTQTLCKNCGEGGKPTTVYLTVPVYSVTTVKAIPTPDTPAIPKPTTLYQTVVYTVTNPGGEEVPKTGTKTIITTTIYRPITEVATIVRTITNSSGDEQGETIVSIPGYIPVTASGPQPAYEVVTETYFPSAPAPSKEVSTQYLITHYETIGSTGIETATITITAEQPASSTDSYELGWSTTTTVCTVCGGEGPQTFTLTIPRITSTLTFVPTSFTTVYPTAWPSGGFGNGTSNGTEYSYGRIKPSLEEVERSTGAAAGRSGSNNVGVAVAVGVFMAVAVLL